MTSRRTYNSPGTRLDSKRVSLEAAFSEPVYERLRFRKNDQDVQFLAFVRPISPELRQFLVDRVGAKPSTEYAADCYAELYELSSQWCGNPTMTTAELDLCIASGISILDGKYGSSAGYWSRPQSDPNVRNKHWTSRLLACNEQGKPTKSR